MYCLDLTETIQDTRYLKAFFGHNFMESLLKLV